MRLKYLIEYLHLYKIVFLVFNMSIFKKGKLNGEIKKLVLSNIAIM